MSIIPNFLYRFNEITIKIQKIIVYILKNALYTERQNSKKSQYTIEGEQNQRTGTTQIQDCGIGERMGK